MSAQSRQQSSLVLKRPIKQTPLHVMLSFWKYKVVQIWPGQTVICLNTNRPGHIWTTLYLPELSNDTEASLCERLQRASNYFHRSSVKTCWEISTQDWGKKIQYFETEGWKEGGLNKENYYNGDKVVKYSVGFDRAVVLFNKITNINTQIRKTVPLLYITTCFSHIWPSSGKTLYIFRKVLKTLHCYPHSERKQNKIKTFEVVLMAQEKCRNAKN